MPIYEAISSLKSSKPSSVGGAQVFLNTLTPKVQIQLISAIYIGREHIHCSRLRDDTEINRTYTAHISNDEFAQIISEKGDNAITYLDKLVFCARASNFDLNLL